MYVQFAPTSRAARRRAEKRDVGPEASSMERIVLGTIPLDRVDDSPVTSERGGASPARKTPGSARRV